VDTAIDWAAWTAAKALRLRRAAERAAGSAAEAMARAEQAERAAERAAARARGEIVDWDYWQNEED